MTTDSSGAPALRVLAIPGDGIGQEVVPAALEVLRATGLPLEIAKADAGWACFQRTGAALPEATLAAARQADAVLFGAVGSPSFPVPGYRSPIVALRRALDLYANIRPTANGQPPTTRAADAVGTALAPGQSPCVDLVVVRENTEGMYAGRERLEDGGDTAIAERVITRRASERIVRAAFELARARTTTSGQGAKDAHSAALSSLVIRPSSPKVTIVHKANVLRETCGLFRGVALGVAEEYPDVAHEEMLVDNCALQLVQRPERFDVIVTTNLFGDILSDVASHWGGGLGLAVSANLGETRALFEPVHGSAPDIAGRGVANPLAAIGCAGLLLEWLAGRGGAQAAACRSWAGRIAAAVAHVREAGPHTPDMGGAANTADITRAVIAALADPGVEDPAPAPMAEAGG
ncbi:isocitrate/isopropylmalate dehydrogenase family protein [Kouleothrix sp.]|uniref:isocitrate/isopropylmalate dehydrogenase family protein n=1 Tax=Kouleothrix sp. TaxID=2779161 RepID=UPI00391C647C